MKNWSTSFAIKEMQIETTLRSILPQSYWQSSRKQRKANTDVDAGEKEPSYTVGGNVKYCDHYQYRGSLKH
jgi:hypothetical protein